MNSHNDPNLWQRGTLLSGSSMPGASAQGASHAAAHPDTVQAQAQGQAAASTSRKPTIILVLMDNLGYGELGVYGGGILRGAPTPRIDGLAAEGTRLLNFNVEAQCTPSRASLLTGRYAVRTGNGSVPIETPVYGLVQREITLAELLSTAGYAAGAFGKWHLGHTAGRYPADQGFDEWYGIPNSTDESYWPDSPLFRANSDPFAVAAQVMEGKKGEAPKNLKVYNLAERRIIDREVTDKAKDFMSRQVMAGKPFFAYIPYTMVHMPVLPAPEFDGKTENGFWADALTQIDTYVGELLDLVDKLSVKDDTIFIFTSDNGAEMFEPWNGWTGPWRGTYFTGLEGSLRVPFIVRWPGKIPPAASATKLFMRWIFSRL